MRGVALAQMGEYASSRRHLARAAAGRAGYLERQQHADAQAILAQVCGDKRARGKDAKRFCDLLLVEPKRPAP